MTAPFRIAIIGAGKIAEVSHVPAVLSLPDAHLVALVDPEPQRARAVAERYGVAPKIRTAVEEILGDVDAAIVATPNHTHHALALACIRAGVHVLVEKPLAVTRAEGEEIAAAAEERGVTVAVGYSSRFVDAVELLGDLIAQNFFGAIHRFAYQFGTRGGWNPASSYILDRKSIGGGVTVVVGTHFLDWMLAWFGYPDEVALADDSLGGPEANAVATFRYHRREAPLVGTMRLSKTVALPPGFVMETDRGTAILEDKSLAADVILRPLGAACEMVLRKPAAVPVTSTSTAPRSPRNFARQLADFVAACRANTPPRVSARQGVESLRLIEALYASRSPLTEFPASYVPEEATA
jgi:predicted dehydrogenase